MGAGSLELGPTAQTTLYSDGTISLTAEDDLTLGKAALRAPGNIGLTVNSGPLTLASTAQVQSTAGDVSLNTLAGSIHSQGEISADAGNLTLRGLGINSSGTLHAGDTLDIADNFYYFDYDYTIVSLSGTVMAHTVSIAASNGVSVNGKVEATGDLTLTAQGDLVVGGGGRILAATSRSAGTGDITAHVLYNDGVVHSYRDLSIDGGVFNHDTGGISALGFLTMTGHHSNFGDLYPGWMDNSPNGAIYGGQGVSMSGYDFFLNSGTLESGADLDITVARFGGGGIKAAGDISITTTSDPGSGMSSFYSGGSIVAGADKTLSIHWVAIATNVGTLSAGTIALTGGSTFNNTGTISAGTLTGGGPFGLVNDGSPQAATVSPVTVTSSTYPGLVLTLPSNPNGRYVPSQNPNSGYLVESNPLYTDIDNFLGSDYLAEKYGFEADTVVKRLGDAAYETYLVEQQLLTQAGSAYLGYASDKDLMRGLMDNAASQAKSLGLTYGKPLTASQQANLKEDMVWMVETTVNGQKVLAPVVYLSATTLAAYETGPGVIAADKIDLNLGSLTNKDGGVITGKRVDITAQGDIRNLGSTIKGGDLALTSTEGSIVNETTTKNVDNHTRVDRQGSISASGNLSLDAGKDIVNKGAKMSAGGDASLSAGNNVVFDTVQETSGSASSSTSKNLFNSTEQSSSTYKIEQVKSELSSGGNLSIKAGKDITLAGTDASAKGGVALDAGGDVNVVERENKEYSYSQKKSEGLFVAGGLYGSETVTTQTEKTRSVGSGITAGKDVTISAGKTVTVRGSDVNAKGDIEVAAEDVQVLAATNTDRKSTTRQTTTVLSITGLGDVKASADANASADASAEASLQNVGSAKAGAGAKAKASTTDGSESESKADAETGVNSKTGVAASADAKADATAKAKVDVGGVDLLKQTTSVRNEEDSKAVGSKLSGGNITITAKKSATLQGAKVDAKKDVNLSGENVNILAAEDKHTVSEKTMDQKMGLYLTTDNTATANTNVSGNASAGTGGGALGASADGSVGASSSNAIDFYRLKKTWSDSTDTSNVGSSVNAGGNLNITSGNKLTVQGSALKAGQDANLKAKDMEFLAGKDSHTSSSSSSDIGIGFYADANVKANANAGANQEVGLGVSGGGNAGAGISGEYSTGFQGRNTITQTTEDSSKAKVSTITAGGSITRAATGGITDVGTAISAGGDFSQTAKTYTSKAAADTASSSSSTMTNSAKLGLYSGGEAKAEAGANVGAGLGATGDAKAEATARVTGGAKASYSGSLEQTAESSSKAVVSNISAGGKVKSVTSDKTSLEGTTLSAGKAVELEAGSLDYAAAKNTTSKTTLTGSVDASGKLGVGVDATKAVAVDLELSGEVKGNKSNESTSTAVAGGIVSKGGISIKTTGDARLEGSTLTALGDTSVEAGGKLDFDAARDTTHKDSEGFNASGSFTTSGGKNSLGVGAEAAGGYNRSTEDTSTAHAGGVTSGGNVKLSAGKTASFEGTNIDAGGDAAISGKEGVAMNATRDTASSSSVGVNASLKLSAETEKEDNKTTNKAGIEASAGVDVSSAKKSDATAGSVKAGRNLTITSDKDVTLEGTDLEAGNKARIDAGGTVDFKAAESTSETSGFGASLSGKAQVKTVSKTGGDSSTGSKTPAGGTKDSGGTDTGKKNPGTGGTQGSDGSKKGDADLSKWQDKQADVLKELKAKQSGDAKKSGPEQKTGTGSGKGTTDKGTTGTSGSGSTSTGTGTGAGTGTGTGTGDNSTTKNTGVGGSGSLNIQNQKTSSKTGGSIKAGAGGVEINARGGNLNLEGTQVTTQGDANLSAKGDVNVSAAKNTESSYGVSVKAKGAKKTETTTSGDKKKDDKKKKNTGTGAGNQGGATGSVGINAGSAVTGSQKAGISASGKLNVTAGGKTRLNDTQVDAKGGTQVQATGGSDRKAP